MDPSIDPQPPAAATPTTEHHQRNHPHFSFLSTFAGDGALIQVVYPDGACTTVSGLNCSKIAERCPRLADAFEWSDEAKGMETTMTAPSRAIASYFLRYIYTGNYNFRTALGGHDLPFPAILELIQLCNMANQFDMPELECLTQLHVVQNMKRDCCTPQMPKDVCASIRFIYEHMPDRKPIIDALVEYCVTHWVLHRLNTDAELLELAYSNVAFHQALVKMNYVRDFMDEGAMEIVQLPVCKPTSTTTEEGDLLANFAFGDDAQDEERETLLEGSFAMIRGQDERDALSEEEEEEGSSLFESDSEFYLEDSDDLDLSSEGVVSPSTGSEDELEWAELLEDLTLTL